MRRNLLPLWLWLACLPPPATTRVSAFLPSAPVTPRTTTTTTTTTALSQSSFRPTRRLLLRMATTDGDENENENGNYNENPDDEAERLRRQAEKLRAQIREMEAALGDSRPRNYEPPAQTASTAILEEEPMSLKGKRVLVVGANGRLGSMVCRYLLRTHPQTEVVACVHYVSENSSSSRGYGRLSYEVGAEDGVGTIGAAWSAEEERNARFEYAEYMKDYNLQNLRLVECELLDPVQCTTICEGVDSVIWCATDFNGNQPRAVSGLNVAFLFRAIAAPTKGRVEVEGLRNLLGGLKTQQQERRRYGGINSGTSESEVPQALNVVVVSTAPEVFDDFETPFGTFLGIKREGEDIIKKEFPSLSYTVLQMGKYDDNFVGENLDPQFEDLVATTTADVDVNVNTEDASRRDRRRINRRDAARVATDALTDNDLRGKTVQVWTETRG